MRLFLGNELLDLTKEDLQKLYVDQGMEAIVYKYGDEAIKIYKEHCSKVRLDEASAIGLSEIYTERILLPRRILRIAENNKFNGYSLSYIDEIRREDIPQIGMSEFVDELDIIDNDLMILADNHVKVADFTFSNLLYNGSFFIGDPGSFEFDKDISKKLIYKANTFLFNTFVTDKIFNMAGVSYYRRKMLKNQFYEWEYIGDQIRKTAKPDESIKQYVIRMTR